MLPFFDGLGRYAEGETLYREALAILEKHFGSDPVKSLPPCISQECRNPANALFTAI